MGKSKILNLDLRPNIWLVKANAISLLLVLVLYIISFANLPHIISHYNIHAFISGSTRHIDAKYIVSLGEQALPAIETLSRYYDSLSKKRGYHNYHRHIDILIGYSDSER